ncbi:MAG: enoyl-CoA hydratase/isomerase family protein [Candidatus Bathyarchaeota archaeon]|nr:enoyl-CoA hydratase/isomerase family protein [Candidatus Bathyarchaeota archaeon]
MGKPSKVLYIKEKHIVTIVINRPEVLNCIDPETDALLADAWVKFRDDENAYVAIITGAGEKSFCTGADLKRWPEYLKNRNVNFLRKRAYYGPGFGGIIAAINGMCYAGGLEIALAADIRLAAEHAKFGVLNRRWNVGLGDGGTQRLPRIVGLGRALELILTGKEIDAYEAYKIGLVNEVLPKDKLMRRAKEVAKIICKYPQGSIKTDKEAVIRGIGRSLEEGLRIENMLFNTLILTHDFYEGPQAFAEKRKPKYTNEKEKIGELILYHPPEK